MKTINNKIKAFIIVFLINILLIFNMNIYGQQWMGSSTIDDIIYRNGKVGIGVSSPAKILTVRDSDASIRLEDSDGPGNSIIRDSYDPSWSTMFITKSTPDGNAQISIDPYPSNGSGDAIFRFFRSTNTTGNVGFYVHSGDGTGTINSAFRGNGDSFLNVISGNVSIGTTDAQGYKFAVAGSAAIDGIIRTTEMEVMLDVWPDYVFEPHFQLKPLCQVENYIKINNHLPDVPPASEVINNGLKVGEMNAILLQKIEELTLYIIELDKKIEKVAKENEILKEQIINIDN